MNNASPHVHLEIAAFSKSAITFIAPIWFVSTVTADVQIEAALRSEFL